jgi:hypothetical protein
MKSGFDHKTDTDDAVEYARTAGRAVYESYSRPNISDPKWSFREDGTIADHTYHVEITPHGDIFGRHADVKQFLKSAELTGKRIEGIANFESHHLVPVEILDQAGINQDDGIAVALDWQGHMQDIHGSGGIQQNLIFTDVSELKNYYVSAYNEIGAPEWGKKVDEYVEKHQESFARGLESAAEQVESFGKDLRDPSSSPRSPKDSFEIIEESSDSIISRHSSDRVK